MRNSFASLLEPYAQGEALTRLVRYAELLERWAPRHNLVRFGSREELVRRHIGDALAAVPELGGARRLLDVGSGGGLPGVPLLAVVPGLGGCLLEPRQKRWAFLRTVARELDLDASVERRRFQELSTHARWDVVTARALGGHGQLLGWAGRRLTEGGRVLIWTTVEEADALRSCSDWRVVSSPLPGLERGRLVRLQPCFT